MQFTALALAMAAGAVANAAVVPSGKLGARRFLDEPTITIKKTKSHQVSLGVHIETRVDERKMREMVMPPSRSYIAICSPGIAKAVNALHEEADNEVSRSVEQLRPLG